MYRILRNTLVLLFLSVPIVLLPQQSMHEAYANSSLDPLLYNGKLYSYYIPKSVSGSQFLYSATFSSEQIMIKGKLYYDCMLNYDIFNQILLLKFEENNGAVRIIEVSEAWLESFTVSGAYFENFTTENNKFYQVLGNGPARILYYYRKDLKLDKTYIPARYTFTPPIRESFVSRSGKTMRYRSNKSFISIFDPGVQDEIKSYLRLNKVKVNKASDDTMKDVISFCNKL